MGKHHPISGAKGSSESAKSPTETPDSLISIAYAKVLDGISEGPIVGLVNGNQSIFLDKTPLANADGSLNFSNVTVATRTGEADQEYVSGFPSVESETAVGVELKASQAWVQSISNLDLSAVRVRLQVPVLSNTDSKGNINGYEVKYAIDVATDSGAYVEVLASSFNGKTTTTYERSHRVELPAAKTGWRIRVRRVTADSTSSSIQSRTSIASYTEIIDAKLRYPYSAVVGITVDASQFSSIPSRAFHAKGRLIRVPSNYTPETRNYAGTWDGTFKLAWTDNPAWIYYDLLLNDRYGLGALITAAQVDRWGLYQIARYCDEMVDDGKGGKEPRFACNVYLQTRAEALQVLQDLASVFRGMAYWAAGSVMAVADMPSDPVYTYNQANVIDGAFTYAGSAKSTRFTVALVSWNDPANFYEKKVEYVSDQKGLARYGVQQTELTAFGCTSQGQAQRLGHYTLLTNRLENETVTFSVGLDGTIARPGQIIRVADEARAGRRIGGRISASTTTTVTLDSDATVAAGDTLVVILPTGVAETRKVKAYADRVVTVTLAFSTAPIAQSVFAIETATLVPQTFRVLSVAEDFGQADLRYTITAVKHVAGKYAAIDSGAQIVTLPVTVIPSSVQAPPTNIQLSSYDSVDQGISISTLRATWEAPANAVSYDVWWRRDSNDWTYAGRCYTSSMEVRGVYAGTYMVRVAAINVLDAASIWAYSQPTALAGKTGAPPALALLKTTPGPWKITLDWAFPAEGAGDSAYTEIQQATTAQGDNAQSMGLFAFPTNTYTLNGLAAGARLFFRGRLIDRIGNVGPWTNWTVGTASTDATEYNQLITEEFVHSALGQELFDRIDLVDADASVPGSVSNRIAETRSALQQELDAVQNQIDQIGDLADAQEYKKTEAYKAGAIVTVDNALFQAKKDVPAAADGSNAPPATAYWRDAGAIIREGDGLASRVTSTENTVRTQDGKITANSTDITQLKTSVSGKAESTTVQALQNQVTSQGNTVTAQGSAITSINAALGDTGGENLLFNPSMDAWTTETQPFADGWEGATDGSATWSKQASSLDPQGFMQRAVLTGLSDAKGAYLVNTFATNKVAMAGQQVTLSVFMKATAGALLYLAARGTAADQTSVGYAEGDRTVANGQWQRVTLTTTLPAGTVHTRFIPRVLGTASLANITWEIDRAQLELGSRASGWRDNGKVNQASINAQVTATTQLAGRVTSVEGAVTSQASSITNLQSNLGNAGGENLLYNPAFTEVSADARLAQGWNLDGGTQDATTSATASLVQSWLSQNEKSMRIDFKGIDTASRYFSINTAVAYRPKAAPGQTVTCSMFLRGTPGIRVQIYIQALNAAGQALAAPADPTTALTGDTQRLSWTFANLPANTAQVSIFYRVRAAANGNGDGFIEGTRAQLEIGSVMTGWSDNGKVLAAQQGATASALSGLTTTVNQQGSNITSQAGQITSLSTSIKGAVQQAFNMVPNPTFDPAFNTMGFYIVQTTAAGVPANCPSPMRPVSPPGITSRTSTACRTSQ